jgi:hypothetical protein
MVNETQVTTDGLKGVRPGREATVGVNAGPGGDGLPKTRRKKVGNSEERMVPDADFGSYYGKPIINEPVWESPDIPGYLFLGGLAGASSVVAAFAQVTRRRRLSRVLKSGATVAAGVSLFALVHDLGRRGRFLNMLRTFKITSPMSVGSWILAGYGPLSAVAAFSEVTGTFPVLGGLATVGTVALGPPLATYTAALVSNTAVPTWHDGHKVMPFLFASSAASSAAALGLMGAPVQEAGPVRALAVVAGAMEMATEKMLEESVGMAKETFEQGKAEKYHKASTPLIAGGVAASLLGRKSRLLSAIGGAALFLGSAATRFAVFEAGIVSANDPKYTVVPQRKRLEERGGRPTPARK